jgi:hypothetical protein
MPRNACLSQAELAAFIARGVSDRSGHDRGRKTSALPTGQNEWWRLNED